MHINFIKFSSTCAILLFSNGMPIYTKIIAASLAEKFNLKDKDAVAAAAVAMKRIMDSKTIP